MLNSLVNWLKQTDNSHMNKSSVSLEIKEMQNKVRRCHSCNIRTQVIDEIDIPKFWTAV
jgi:hypothetical protein